MMDWIGDVLLKWLGSLDLVDSEQHSQENIKKCNPFFIKAWQIKAINKKKKTELIASKIIIVHWKIFQWQQT